MKEETQEENLVILNKRYCAACQEDPCMCSDPEQTSTTYDW